jgi:prephenate dehydrogenase
MARPQVTIVGLGLIGTSLGLALREIDVDLEIVGHDLEHAIAKSAAKLGAIHRAEWNLIRAVEDADIIFLAIPVMAIRDTLAAIAEDLKEGVLITDTAATKQQVMAWAEELLPPHANFVGGDPIVKRAGRGQAAARADLFRGALYCVVPAPSAAEDAVQLLTGLVSSIGAEPFFLDAAEHDGLMAGVGHLPFVLAATMVHMAADSPSSRDLQRVVGQEYRSSTEFFSSDPSVYRDLCLTNAGNIVRWIDSFIAYLSELRDVLEEEDEERLDDLFSTAMETRERWLKGVPITSPISEAVEQASRGGLRSLLFGTRFGG